MHSYGLAKDILKAALSEAERNEGNTIESILIKVGQHDYSEADSIRFCLDEMVKGTAAEGAGIQIEQVDTSSTLPGESPLSVSIEIA